ncbi:6-phosphofructokinase, alpha subunit [Scheffersomyces spartinae]|uniref:ATP-dependent 6-phosphofructokinase n=1 Tax=Scheffersomyces spartinae TaxID=45513 RepID=A0A9P7V8K5_9ASCO|nr:6-phosphofructokinase, alpha subunit [Scheffersomyces spartinae]KAG7193174.1 6-phosphofructokinase, alpha subunit [Scheffersomyces spartinae]
MPSIDTVQGISSISLVTDDADKFNKVTNFYNSLGLRLVKSFSKLAQDGQSSEPKTHLGISHDSLKEIWLESFPLQREDETIPGAIVPWQDLEIYIGDDSEPLCDNTLLKIRLSTFPVHASEKDLLTLNFFSTNLTKAKSILTEKLNVKLIEDTPDFLSLKDPLDNVLIFRNSLNDLAREKYNSPKEYLEKKATEILAHITEKIELDAESDETSEATKKKKKIAVMTSGGDAPGMNPAVRAVVRAGIYLGCDVFAVYEGYTGLVTGGDLLKKMSWGDVRGFLSYGGTNIGTARCMEFRKREGRLMGAYNMISNGIDALIVCGGDGSLTGADLFRAEWPSLLDELIETGRLTKSQVAPHRNLTIVGLVGSIDNDMAMTDATIGAYSALERISEMVDYIDATASSHSRAFVVEVMGRHCGWLGLMAGLSTGADFIFIPERPPKHGKWQEDLKHVCSKHRAKGRRKTTVIVAEGAIDDQLQPITSDEVKKVLVELGLDTRITTLGHVQRGGTAVAYDRLLSTLQGVEAVKAVLDLTPEDPSPMIGILENRIVRRPLVEAVALTKSVADAIESKDFDKAMSLRDTNFAEAYHSFNAISIDDDDETKLLPESERLNIGVVHVGASSSGLNAATRAAALYCLSKGHKLFGIVEGFSGLIETGEVRELKWLDVENWHNKGGSELGTNRSLPSADYGKVAYYLQKYNLQGLIIIGGFEGFSALHELYSETKRYPIFNIPKILIPSTVSNNVPGSEYSLGSDTCLNQLVKYCDAVKQSASSSRRRVFVVEVQGGHSGYVASYCGLITGAIATYTPEAKIDLSVLQSDIDLLLEVFANDRGEDRNGKMIIRNEQASTVYSTELIADLLKENSGKRFETRTAIPGHVQQGYTPSSMDRVVAIRFATKAIQFIESENKIIANDEYCSPSVVLGVQGTDIKLLNVAHLYSEDADVKLRKGKTVHWREMTYVSDMLSGKLMLLEGKEC